MRYLRSVNYVIRNLLPTEIVTKMSSSKEEFDVEHTNDQCNTAKMAGEYNTPMRGAVTKQIGLPTYFWLITMIRNCQKCFILHSASRSIRALAVFLIKQC